MREVELHEGLQKILSNAFWNCSSLERFTFPSLTTRLDIIIRVGQTQVGDKVDNINTHGFGIRRRGSVLFISAEYLKPSVYTKWNLVKETLDQIDQLLTYYELKEATMLLELAMWKAKIDQAEVQPNINRDVHRIDIPGPVMNTILQYLNYRV